MNLAKSYILTVALISFCSYLLGLSFSTQSPRWQHRGNFDLVAAEARCEVILHKLVEKQGGGIIPKISIEEIHEYGKPAEYDFERKTIVIDPKAYNLCLNISNHQDDALAFLIAHEYVHAYQHKDLEYVSPGFFVETKTLKAWARGQRDRRRLMESQADIQGAILCYLSGYEVSDIIPLFIEDLYETFNLKASDPLYDSKEERMAIAARAQEDVRKLILQYDMANYLSILQEHSKDTVIYNYLIESFRSAEFYNNLGLSYMMQALPQLEEPYRSCPYPFVLDTETRLQNALSKNQLSPEALLRKSIAYFNQVLVLNDAYLAMRINRACAYHLLGSLDEENRAVYKTKAERDIAFIKQYESGLYQGRLSELEQLKHNAHLVSAIIAFPNMCKEKDQRPFMEQLGRWNLNWKVDQVNLSNPNELKNIEYDWESMLSFAQDISLKGKQLAHSFLMVYHDPTNRESFYFQKINEYVPGLVPQIYQVGVEIPSIVQEKLRKSLPSLQGDYFLVHDALGVIYRLDKTGTVKEWVRYY